MKRYSGRSLRSARNELHASCGPSHSEAVARRPPRGRIVRDAACEAHATSFTRAAGLRAAKLRPADLREVESDDALFGAQLAKGRNMRAFAAESCGPPTSATSNRSAHAFVRSSRKPASIGPTAAKRTHGCPSCGPPLPNGIEPCRTRRCPKARRGVFRSAKATRRPLRNRTRASPPRRRRRKHRFNPVSYTHLRAHETG